MSNPCQRFCPAAIRTPRWSRVACAAASPLIVRPRARRMLRRMPPPATGPHPPHVPPRSRPRLAPRGWPPAGNFGGSRQSSILAALCCHSLSRSTSRACPTYLSPVWVSGSRRLVFSRCIRAKCTRLTLRTRWMPATLPPDIAASSGPSLQVDNPSLWCRRSPTPRRVFAACWANGAPTTGNTSRCARSNPRTRSARRPITWCANEPLRCWPSLGSRPGSMGPAVAAFHEGGPLLAIN
jgi:hypothetical protein